MIKQTDLNVYTKQFAFRRIEKRIRYKCSNCNVYLGDEDVSCKVCGCELIAEEEGE